MNEIARINSKREHYGRQLKIRRNKLGLTQELVARELGVAQPQVSNLEQVGVTTRFGRAYLKVLEDHERRRAVELVLEHPEVPRDPQLQRQVLSTLFNAMLDAVFPDDGAAGTPALRRSHRDADDRANGKRVPSSR